MAIDWTKSMQQTYEFYTVDPNSWMNVAKLDAITGGSINRDDENELLESASFETTEAVDECYVRVCLICIQNGVKYEPIPLGTFMVQTPSTTFNGRNKNITMDAYSPLIELKDSKPPYGYALMSTTSVMTTAADIVFDNCRAPVVRTSDSTTLDDDFVADFDNDTWLTFLSDLISVAGYSFGLDEMSRVIFSVKRDAIASTPVWTYNDDNSSILYPDITLEKDLYGIPNVVEVLYSSDNGYKLGRAVNKDPGSITSTVTRGREVVYRVTNPEDLVNPSQAHINNYAEELLRSMSVLENTISYTHGYCPVRVGDCVMLNYERAGLTNIKAVVKSQTIKCSPGTEVSETAVYTTKLWG